MLPPGLCTASLTQKQVTTGHPEAAVPWLADVFASPAAAQPVPSQTFRQLDAAIRAAGAGRGILSFV